MLRKSINTRSRSKLFTHNAALKFANALATVRVNKKVMFVIVITYVVVTVHVYRNYDIYYSRNTTVLQV